MFHNKFSHAIHDWLLSGHWSSTEVFGLIHILPQDNTVLFYRVRQKDQHHSWYVSQEKVRIFLPRSVFWSWNILSQI